jgi:hypothetical protein
VLAPILDKFLSMPMFIIVAALAPEGVEVTMFAVRTSTSDPREASGCMYRTNLPQAECCARWFS